MRRQIKPPPSMPMLTSGAFESSAVIAAHSPKVVRRRCRFRRQSVDHFEPVAFFRPTAIGVSATIGEHGDGARFHPIEHERLARDPAGP
jgi:hypothetical protein